MTLIRLITVIIRLRLADSKGVSRNSRRVRKRTKERKEEKKQSEKREKGSFRFWYHDFLRKIRYSCLTKSLREGMQTLPARC